MTIETLMTAMNTVASTIVLWSAICATNHMCRQTTFLVRAAYIMLGVGPLRYCSPRAIWAALRPGPSFC